VKFYRAVSAKERLDYKRSRLFRTSKNTLEAKQFFKSETGVLEFILESKKAGFLPPYKYLYHIYIDEICLSKINYDEQLLDGYAAITIRESHLQDFNNCVNLVRDYVI
jgi:hypothetical protein